MDSQALQLTPFEIEANGALPPAPDEDSTLVVNLRAHEVRVDGRPIRLTLREFALLAYLWEHRGQVLSRPQLLSDVWGDSYTGGPRTVDIHVRRLRIKLGRALPLVTLRRVGYALRSDPEQQSRKPDEH